MIKFLAYIIIYIVCNNIYIYIYMCVCVFNVLGEFNLLSDGSSPNTSAGNTPDSGDALDESTDSGVSGPASLPPTLSASSTASSLSNASVEKRSVRELAASLNKSKTERKENGKKQKYVFLLHVQCI